MANITLTAAPTLGGYARRWGETSLTERGDLALVSVAIPMGDDVRVEAGLKAFGAERPSPTVATLGEVSCLQTGADQLMLVFPHQGPRAVERVREKMPVGYLTDQTDAWVVLELSGPLALPALERLSMIDLDAQVFGVGAFARTTMEHMGALILRTETGYLLMSASSSAGSFLHALETSLKNVSPT